LALTALKPPFMELCAASRLSLSAELGATALRADPQPVMVHKMKTPKNSLTIRICIY